MQKFIPAIVVVTAIVVVILGLFLLRPAVVDDTTPPKPASGSTVIIISPHNEGIQSEFKRAFELWHEQEHGAPATVEWRDHGGANENVRFIESEFTRSPGGIGVDMFWGGGSEPYMYLADKGLLQPVELPDHILAALPSSVAGIPVYDSLHRWYGTALSGFGIIYGRKRLAAKNLPEPRTWADLAEPRFLNEVAAADPRRSGSAHAIVEVILQAYGYEKGFGILTRMAGNTRKFTRAAGDVPKLISVGDVAAGLAIDFYAWTQIQQDGKDRIGYVLPEGLTAFTPDAIATFKGAPNPTLAKRFLEFVLSPAGQRLWVLSKGTPGGPVEYNLLRTPVLPEVYRKHAGVTNVMIDPSQAKAHFQYDAAKAAARRSALEDLYGTVLIDLGPELSAAWQAVIDRGLDPADLRTLTAPLLTEQQLTELATKHWSNPRIRNEKIAEWARAARKRYRSLQR